jgi:hypothetical protein
MKRWTPEEDAILLRAVKDGLSQGKCALLLVGRSRNAIHSRADRLDVGFGVGHAPGRKEKRNAERAYRQRREVKPASDRPAGSWDVRLFEPWAERKARLARERAAA